MGRPWEWYFVESLRLFATVAGVGLVAKVTGWWP